MDEEEDGLPAPFWDSIEEYDMADKGRFTLSDLKIVLLGIPDTDDMGLYGEVKETRKLIKELNGMVRSDHAWVCALRWVVGLLAFALIGTVTAGQLGVW